MEKACDLKQRKVRGGLALVERYLKMMDEKADENGHESVPRQAGAFPLPDGPVTAGAGERQEWTPTIFGLRYIKNCFQFQGGTHHG